MTTAPIQIVSAKHINEYRLQISFSDSSEQIIDFKPFLTSSQHPEISKYLDTNLFQTFSIENGDLMWGDFDLIFPIHDLYTNSILKIKHDGTQEAS